MKFLKVLLLVATGIAALLALPPNEVLDNPSGPVYYSNPVGPSAWIGYTAFLLFCLSLYVFILRPLWKRHP